MLVLCPHNSQPSLLSLQMLNIYTEIEFFKTEEEPVGSNAAAIGVSVTFSILFLIAIAVVLVVVYIMWR